VYHSATLRRDCKNNEKKKEPSHLVRDSDKTCSSSKANLADDDKAFIIEESESVVESCSDAVTERLRKFGSLRQRIECRWPTCGRIAALAQKG